ncbi:MAG: DKNYY domain-containing protein [Chitinophagaceae bacterium]|nr:DKNYY domain-containing protein [Chitinophagaceae bacterium]
MAVFKLFRSLLKVIFIATGILPFFKCSSGYKETNGKKTYNGKEITDATFKILNDAFATDSATAYFKEHPITGADVTSFIALDEHYAKDKKYVYYCNESRDGQTYFTTKRNSISTIDGALPESFKLLESGYAYDKQAAYFEGTQFRVKNPAALRVISRFIAADSSHVYYNTKLVHGAEGKTFEIIDSHYAKDQHNIYYYGFPSEPDADVKRICANNENFKPLDYPYATDTKQIYFRTKSMTAANPATFKILDNGFSTDGNLVFFQSKKIAGVDAKSFIAIPLPENVSTDGYYATDTNAVYFKQYKLPGASIESFTIMNLGYSKDDKQVYFHSTQVVGADLQSFKTYPHGMGDADAEDKMGKYFEGKKVREEE